MTLSCFPVGIWLSYLVIILHGRCLGNIRCYMTVTFCFGMFILYSQENTYHVILCRKICQTKFRGGIWPPKFRIKYDKRYILGKNMTFLFFAARQKNGNVIFLTEYTFWHIFDGICQEVQIPLGICLANLGIILHGRCFIGNITCKIS